MNSQPDQSAADQLLQQAATRFQQGQLVDAENMLRQLLQQYPDFMPALMLLGVVLHHQQKPAQGVPFLIRATEIQPQSAPAFLNCGTILLAAGQTSLAIEKLLRATQLQANYLPAISQLAKAFELLAEFEKALPFFSRWSELAPLNPEPIRGRLNALLQLKRFAEVISIGTSISKLSPHFRLVGFKLHTAFAAMKLHDRARIAYEELCQSTPPPGSPTPDTAADLALMHSNMGCIFYDLGDFEQAKTHFQTAIGYQPNDPALHQSLIYSTKELGQLDQAMGMIHQVLRVDPGNHGILDYQAEILQLQGDWRSANRILEHRLLMPDYQNKLVGTPWDGSNPAGLRLLVRWEQGFGDTIQMCRYIKLLADKGAKVVLDVQNDLRSLMRTVPGVWQIQSDATPVAKCDASVWMMSLPFYFQTTFDNVPNHTPYIFALPTATAAWKQKLQQLETPGRKPTSRIGIVYSGSPTHLRDQWRSMKIEELRPLFTSFPDVQWISLQKSGARNQLVNLRLPGQVIHDLGPQLNDFAESAALIANLDLVITVDTSVAHLTGAMNKPVWVFLAANNDARWSQNRPDTPLYPSMRLFRQTKLGQWTQVIDHTIIELKKRLQ